MNTLKIIIPFLLFGLLNSCTKKEPTTERSMCDNITLTVNNLLPDNLDNIVIGNENFGTIEAGQSQVLCLESSGAYSPTPTELMLFMQAEYLGEAVSDGYFCGTGLMSVEDGEFEMDITEVNNQFLNYSFK